LPPLLTDYARTGQSIPGRAEDSLSVAPKRQIGVGAEADRIMFAGSREQVTSGTSGDPECDFDRTSSMRTGGIANAANQSFGTSMS